MASLLKMMAELGLNVGPFQAGLKGAQNAATNMSSSIGSSLRGMAASYFGFQALQATFRGVVTSMGAIQDRADQFNISTDDVQRLGIAAEDVGLSFEDAGSALMRLGAARKAALGGDQEKINAFNKLGVGGMLESGASDVDIMKAIGGNIRNMKMDSETTQMFRELMGRGGARMLAVLQEMNAAKPEALISAEDIKSVDVAEAAVKRLAREMREQVAPSIGVAAETLSTFLEKWSEVRKANEGEKVPLVGKPIKFAAEALEAVQRTLTSPEDKFASAMSKQASKSASRGAASLFAQMTGVNPLSTPVAETTPEMYVNPVSVTAARKAEFEMEQRMEAIAFGRMDATGKIGKLEQDIRDRTQGRINLQQQLTAGLITQEQYERYIAENKKDQLDAEEKIYQLKSKPDSISSAEFEKMTFGSGIDPSAFRAPKTGATGKTLSSEMVNYVAILKDIERNTGKRTMFIGW
jgi:hypothetical protein